MDKISMEKSARLQGEERSIVMKRFALVILTDSIKVREFEHKDDWITARQTLATNGIKFIVLKWHEGAHVWVMPEMYE